MNLKRIFLGGLLSVAILFTLGGVALTSFGPGQAFANGPWGIGADDRGPSGVQPVHRRMGRGSPQEKCERMDPAHVKYAGAFAAAYLDLDATQRGALDPVLEALRAWATEAKTLCSSLDSESIDDHLLTAQAFLTISAEALEDVRVAYAGFEPSLTEDQKAQVKEAISRARSRRHRG
ncbi:MAG: hypothetical protein AAF648_07735 [Pseudomonadota bacterium]